MQTLRGRLGAARLTLASVAEHPAALAGTSRIEAKATCELLDRFADTLTDEERTLLISVVTQSQFVPSDSECIISRIVATSGSVKCRRKQQDYTLFYLFLDRVRWTILQATDRSVADKESVLICFLKDLGLRLPSEPTFKVASSFLLLVTESWEAVSRMSVPYKKAALSRFKSNWRVALRSTPAPCMWIQNLPKTTSEFQASFPLEWNSLYGAGGPVPPEIDIVRLHMVDSSYKCRAYEHNDIPCTVPLIANSHGVIGGGGGGGGNNFPTNSLEAFAGIFMKGFADMQAQQSRMAELMFSGNNGGGGGCNGGNRPRGLQALIDQSVASSPSPKVFPIMIGESPGSASNTSSSDIMLHFPESHAGSHSHPRPGQAVSLQLPTEPAAMQVQRLPGQPPLLAAPPVNNGQTRISPTPVVGTVKPAAGAVKQAAGTPHQDDDDSDDAPLTALAAKKEITPADAAEARVEAMLARMKQREQLKKSQKAMAAKNAPDARGVAVAEDAAAKKGPGRPRGTGAPFKAKVPVVEAPKRVRVRGKSSPK